MPKRIPKTQILIDTLDVMEIIVMELQNHSSRHTQEILLEKIKEIKKKVDS